MAAWCLSVIDVVANGSRCPDPRDITGHKTRREQFVCSWRTAAGFYCILDLDTSSCRGESSNRVLRGHSEVPEVPHSHPPQPPPFPSSCPGQAVILIAGIRGAAGWPLALWDRNYCYCYLGEVTNGYTDRTQSPRKPSARQRTKGLPANKHPRESRESSEPHGPNYGGKTAVSGGKLYPVAAWLAAVRESRSDSPFFGATDDNDCGITCYSGPGNSWNSGKDIARTWLSGCWWLGFCMLMPHYGHCVTCNNLLHIYRDYWFPEATVTNVMLGYRLPSFRLGKAMLCSILISLYNDDVTLLPPLSRYTDTLTAGQSWPSDVYLSL